MGVASAAAVQESVKLCYVQTIQQSENHASLKISTNRLAKFSKYPAFQGFGGSNRFLNCHGVVLAIWVERGPNLSPQASPINVMLGNEVCAHIAFHNLVGVAGEKTSMLCMSMYVTSQSLDVAHVYVLV